MYNNTRVGDPELDAFAEGAPVLQVGCCGYDLFVHPETEHFQSNASSIRKTITASEFGYLVSEVVSMGKRNPRVIPQLISEISMFPVILNTACSYSSRGLLLVDFPRIDVKEVKLDRCGTLETRIINHFRSTSDMPVIDNKRISPIVRREVSYSILEDATKAKTVAHESKSSARKLLLQSAFGDQGCSALLELSKYFNRTRDAFNKGKPESDLEIYAASSHPRDPITQELNNDFVTPLAVFGARGHVLSIDFAYIGCESSVYRVLRRWRS